MADAGKLALWWPLPGARGWPRLLGGACAAAAAVGAAWWSASALRRRLRRARQVRIEQLYVYPIKSCRGHAVPCVELTPWGLKDDRLYVIASASGRFLSQRELPRMAMVHPDLPTASGITLRAVPTESAAGAGALPLPPPLFVPLVREAVVAPSPVGIWKDSVPAVDQGHEAAAWLQSFLGSDGVAKDGLRLMRIADSAHRTTDPNFGKGETAFADGFPILLTSQASVDHVKRQVKSVDIRLERFRPNVHISGCAAFEEDEMRTITFGGTGAAASSGPSVVLRLVKPCSRCTIPTIVPEAGTRTPNGEPMRTLRSYRTGRELQSKAKLHRAHFARPESAAEAFFGQNAHLEFARGASLSVGDLAGVGW